jgi:hypothetical protein
MNKNRLWWRFLEVVVVLLYAAVIAGGYVIHQPRPGWVLAALLAIFTLTEIYTALRIGKEKQVHLLRIICMTILFGFTWWVPLRQGIIDR